MRQKIIYIFIILFLLLGLNLIISNESYATMASGTVGTCKWEITDDGTLIIHEGVIKNRGTYVLGGWYSYRKDIKRVEITEKVICYTAGCLFEDLSNCVSMNLSGLDTSNVTNMWEMFEGCSSLESLDLSNFNTKNVTDMWGMFLSCSSLVSLNLSSFDTSNLTTMYVMFESCSSLESLDLSNFNTSKVTNMNATFSYCTSLKYINLNSFNTTNVTSMYGMFEGCSSLESLDLSSFNTSNVEKMHMLFSRCSSLKNINLSNFNTSNVESMFCMFSDCSSFTSLDLSNFNTSNVTSMNSMFGGCYSLESLDLSNFNTSNVTSMSSMFSGCSSLESLDLSNFNTSKVIGMSNMFEKCTSLINLDISNFDTSNVKYMDRMFNRCEKLTKIDLRSFSLNSLKSCSYMFANCDYELMYNSEDTDNLNEEELFYITKEKYCNVNENSLKTILISEKWNFYGDDVKAYGMFLNSKSLVGGYGTAYDENYINGEYAFADSNTQEGYLTKDVLIKINESNESKNDLENNEVSLDCNDNKSITITPTLGYEIVSIIDNGENKEINSREEYIYELKDVTEYHEIEIETKVSEYKIISGDNQERKEKKAEELIIKSDGLFEIFTGLEINGVELVKDKDYKVEKGSTIVTLSKEYLDTLDKGEYKIKFKYSNGSEPVGTMKIVDVASVNSNQNDNSNSSNAQVENQASSVISKALYTGDSILKITIPIILVIITLNIMQVKLQKTRKKNRKPRIGSK